MVAGERRVVSPEEGRRGLATWKSHSPAEVVARLEFRGLRFWDTSYKVRAVIKEL